MRVIFLGNSAEYSPYFVETLARRSRDPSDRVSLLAVVCPMRFRSRRSALWFSTKRRLGDLAARVPTNVIDRLGLPALGAWQRIERAAALASAQLLWPRSLAEPAMCRRIATLEADVAIVAGLDRIVKGAPFDSFPPLYNIHPSLLPQFRGATPEFWQIDSGATQGGVTLHRIEAGIDTGPIVLQRRFPIEPWLDADALLSRSAKVGAELMGEFLDCYPKIAENPIPQLGGSSQPAATSRDHDVPFTRSASDVFNRARAAGYRTALVLYVSRDDWEQRRAARQLTATNAWHADALALHLYEPVAFPDTTEGPPGAFRCVEGGAITLTCNPGTVFFRRVEPGSAKRANEG